MSDIRRSLNNIDDIVFAVKRTVRRNEKLEADNRRLRLAAQHAIERAKELEAQLAKAVNAIDGLLAVLPDDEGPEIDYARTTIAELKGEK